jgi:hypothetical protein
MRCLRLLLLSLLLQTPPALGFEPPGERPLADVLQLVVLRREVRALDASGGEIVAELERGEQIHWHAARGRVGVVLTDRRVLAVTSLSAAWQESRYRLRESPPSEALLGETVALVITASRAIGLDGGSGNLIEKSLGPGEIVLAVGIAENVGVVVTDRRALGISPFAGGFFEAHLPPGERYVRVEASANFASVHTSRRILNFRAPSGSWVESHIPLR